MTSQRLQTAKKFIGHFETMDTQVLEELLADNYEQKFAPASLGLPSSLSKRGFIDHLGGLKEILSGFPVTAKEYIESESGNQVVVWATAQAIFREELRDEGSSDEEWVFRGEYVFMISMDETGEKIVRIVEFLDSKATDDKFWGLRNQALENKKKLEG